MYYYPLRLCRFRSLVTATLFVVLITGCGGGGSNGGTQTPPPPTPDTTPAAFSFPAVTDVQRSSVVESAAATITGIDAAANISISGGEYSIAGGAYTSTPGSISNNQTVMVKLLAAAQYATDTVATLTVDSVASDFRVATIAAPDVLIDVNANVRHSVSGVDAFDRAKFITIHADASEHDWFGNNVQSRNEPNALPDLMQDFLGDKDVYLGRNTGGITFYLGEMAQDPARPGFVDETNATNTGNSVRSNYSNNSAARWVSTRAFDNRAVNMVVAAQQHPFWPDGTTTRQGWALSQTDTVAEPFGTATGHWMGQYLAKFYRPAGTAQDGADKPPLIEVMNEPVYDLHDFPPLAQPPELAEPLDRIFEYHNAVASEIRATNNDVLIGGYTAAFPNFEEDNFDRWRDRDQRFLDLAGASMDFVSIHLYDFAAIDRGAGVVSEYRKGSNVEATFDMLDQYSTQLFGAPTPTVISEYGGRAHVMENDPWSPERDWVTLKSMNSLLMAFLERPDNILMTIPFVVVKAEWGRTAVPYPWRLMRQRFEATGESGNEWVYTELVRFYELWSDVNGTRVDSWADDPDILVDAYLDGVDLFVIVNNLEFDDSIFNLDIAGVGDIVAVNTKHLRADNGVPVLETETRSDLPEAISLGSEATMILQIELDAAPKVDQISDETKHYATSMLQPITANTTLTFDVDDVPVGAAGEAVLRLGVGRAHGLSLQPTVTVNGISVSVPADYRGYEQDRNGAGRAEFFGVLEIPVPWAAMTGSNRIEVTFAEDGGHVSSVALQIFNQSQAVIRGAR